MKKIVTVASMLVLLSLFAVQPVSADPAFSGQVIHVVRWGENLTGIARAYGTTIQAIVQANGLASANRIYVGQRLIIPTVAVPPPSGRACAHVIRPGNHDHVQSRWRRCWLAEAVG